MSNNFLDVKRRDLDSLTREMLHTGRGFQSSVRLIERDKKLAAVKDYINAPKWFRLAVSPFLLNREERALRVLAGTRGVPEVYARVDRYALAMEYLEGTPMDRFTVGQLAPEVFEKAQQTIDAIHTRGVSHCDLKRRSNLLLSPSGEVFLIDFAAAVIGRRALHPVMNWLQREMEKVDNKSVPRLKKFVAPELLSPEDRRRLETPTVLEKWARKLFNR
jgi:RIO-like serine/threonine protein kinase